MIEITKEFIVYSIEILKINYFLAPNNNVKYKKLLKRAENNEILQISIYIISHIDDGSLPFDNRDNIILGIKLYIEIIAKFRLIVHMEKKNKALKIEVMFILGTSMLYYWQNP